MWEDGTNSAIRYVDVGTGGPTLSFSNSYQVSPSAWTSNERPSVGVVNGTSVVVWESYNNITEGGSSVHIRKRPSGTWESTITSFSHSGADALSPVIGTIPGATDFTVVWTYANDVYRVSWAGLCWSGPYLTATSASEPTLDLRGYDSYLQILWRSTNGTIGMDLIMPSFGKIAVLSAATTAIADSSRRAVTYRLNRHALVDLGGAVGDVQAFKGMVAFEIAGMKLTGASGEQKLSLARSGMQSDRFTVSKDLSSLSFAGAIYGAKLSVPAEVGTLIASRLRGCSCGMPNPGMSCRSSGASRFHLFRR